MPTNEWFQENPKVSAYISKSLNHQLEEWMKQRSIKKVSQALTTILEEHLGVVQIEPKNGLLSQEPINYATVEQLESIQGKSTA